MVDYTQDKFAYMLLSYGQANGNRYKHNVCYITNSQSIAFQNVLPSSLPLKNCWKLARPLSEMLAFINSEINRICKN